MKLVRGSPTLLVDGSCLRIRVSWNDANSFSAQLYKQSNIT